MILQLVASQKVALRKGFKADPHCSGGILALPPPAVAAPVQWQLSQDLAFLYNRAEQH